MLHLNDDEVDDLRDMSLADAIIEARRRIKANFDKIRADINAHFDEQIPAINTSASGSHPTFGAHPTATSDEAPAPDAPCDSATWISEEDKEEDRNVRRRLSDDTPRLDAKALVNNQFDGP